ncbi:hypothetical protein HYR99_12420 [Candidatus Poribacteria bacterium]|nr:hypothetical protein [Candidatus Poribacteria bacterium]
MFENFGTEEINIELCRYGAWVFITARTIACASGRLVHDGRNNLPVLFGVFPFQYVIELVKNLRRADNWYPGAGTLQ